MSGLGTIVGIGEADGGRATGRRGVELAAEASLRAVDDAGIDIEAVDGLLVESPDVDQHHMAHLAVADALGWRPSFAYSVGCGGATPIANVMLAASALTSGAAHRILLVDYDARQTRRDPDPAKRMSRTSGHRNPWEDPYGPVTAAKFALVARSHMDRFGTTRAQLAEITVNARKNGARRAGAQLREPVTIDEVLDSPPIAEPIHRLDCCIISDWGSAIVISREAPEDPRGIDVLGFGQAHEGYAVSRARDLATFPHIAASGQAAFKMAGVDQDDVDVALIYDSFTITLLVALENLGFCQVGDGGNFVADGSDRDRWSAPR